MTDGQPKDEGIIPVGIPQVTDLTDLAVAKAIGMETALLYEGKVLITPREWDEIRGIEHPTCEGDVACQPFRPSTDLNAAFAAAEVAELFHEDGPEASFSRYPADAAIWQVRWEDESAPDGSWAVYAPTPALAICAAILKLKGVSGD